ncbi:hypothetical protein [Neolewinella persica]|uniref:hypothetical protein n=1 Tax=Neolewinella persica TaxID=70998 RepID=UPI00036EA993|nr:hypothetical protein [Neolewinella persica]
MRNRLHKFTEFTGQLLPHETAYLLRTQQLEDPERLAILQRVDLNCRQVEQFTPYDLAIDKRKYHHLQKWIQQRLDDIDVDVFHEWLLEAERRIMTDSIETKDEKKLLKLVRHYQHPSYFFMKFYEVLKHYRHFLQIRLRYQDHRLVNDFLIAHATPFHQSKECYDQLHDITQDVVEQYANQSNESEQWQDLLENVFRNENMDGLNRYLALVRLTFIGFNYHNYDRVLVHFDYLDQSFQGGRNYSRRILANYYGNRLLLHSQRREYEKAVYYGLLSVRARNYDYLFYVNNLAAVQLRLGRQQEALNLLQSAKDAARTTVNPHNRIGYTAFYLEALIRNGRLAQALSYGDSYLRAYRKDILRYRWHLFFTVYLQVLLLQDHNEKALKLIRQFKLEEKDRSYSVKAGYLPTIPILLDLARWREGLIDNDTFYRRFRENKNAVQENGASGERFAAFRQTIAVLLPEGILK